MDTAQFPELAEFFDMIPWKLIIPVLILELILLTVAIVDLIRREETNGPKWLWLIIILGFNLVGPVVYFIIGRRPQ
ncbi:transcriptional regulator [Pontibacillus yanchengensis]|uniref:Transcriptional regulator n=2 Tax=Pontibacillus yanchengensis TaxID=462910 RepID=A0ACC7VL19_9BACI|nr:PLD nuclease N-terminal domain-containing protein [Pontibacillus yanchengensis]MYL35225.1 transcriptional regulator [Pontibacillus yanchengensis]MYL54835.1 transcriptional regulator [Pontibacillus yanchengensis]